MKQILLMNCTVTHNSRAAIHQLELFTGIKNDDYRTLEIQSLDGEPYFVVFRKYEKTHQGMQRTEFEFLVRDKNGEWKQYDLPKSDRERKDMQSIAERSYLAPHGFTAESVKYCDKKEK